MLKNEGSEASSASNKLVTVGTLPILSKRQPPNLPNRINNNSLTNLFYKASITLIPKPVKGTMRKETTDQCP